MNDPAYCHAGDVDYVHYYDNRVLLNIVSRWWKYTYLI
jgi:hypothetical protein